MEGGRRLGHLVIADSGRSWQRLLGDEALVVGRGGDCDVVLADPTVSRHHALVEPTPTGWEVRDVQSRHGTTLNGRVLSRPSPLAAGDRVGIGRCTLTFRSGSPSLSATAEPGPVRGGREGLSAREWEVLRLLARGHTDRAVAEELCISVATVHSHLDRIRDKTGRRRRGELAAFAVDHGAY